MSFIHLFVSRLIWVVFLSQKGLNNEITLDGSGLRDTQGLSLMHTIQHPTYLLRDSDYY